MTPEQEARAHITIQTLKRMAAEEQAEKETIAGNATADASKAKAQNDEGLQTDQITAAAK